MTRPLYRRLTGVAVVMTIVASAALIYGGTTREREPGPSPALVEFYDAPGQAEEFIAYYVSSSLTPEQEAVKKAALSRIPAPCCRNFTIATCCCPCNLAESVWGLADYLIAEGGYDAEQVRMTVEQWIQFINPGGYAGNACYKKRCNLPFAADGCGGMGDKVIS